MRTELGFDEAIKDYKEFLSGQGLSDDIVWVFQDDVTVEKWRVCIRWPLPPENPRLAEELYERGRDKGLGLALDTFCLANGKPCCYIWVPEDEIDADQRMLSKLKMSVPTEPKNAKIIRSRLLWKIINWLDSRSEFRGFMDELPRRN